MSRALGDADLRARLKGHPLSVIAAGKAAGSMVSALALHSDLDIRRAFAVATHGAAGMPASIEFREASHPRPDARSVAAGARALDIANSVAADGCLLVLLSGGASSLLAVPAEGLTLEDKQCVTDALLRGGADIQALNTVRKHLSGIKGGRLAAACRGTTVTIAISDVIGDDLAVIGSGPAVADPTTWNDAAEQLARYMPEPPAAVRAAIARGVAGALPDTPKAGDPRLARASARVIASRRDAMNGARDEALRLGYAVRVLDDAVSGDARGSAGRWFERVSRELRDLSRPACVISSGETTVTVKGGGKGGRNQEFALALARLLPPHQNVAAASVGTDGIDGPTDAAGALVDATTVARAAGATLAPPEEYLDANDSYAFFDRLNDLIRTGPTDTNVGDLQVLLAW